MPPIFRWLAEAGNVDQSAMFDTFNMGIGFVVIVPAEQAELALDWFKSENINAAQIGKVVSGEGTLSFV